MAQYKLRQKSGAEQPEVSKWGGGFNVIVVLICALVSILIWFGAVKLEYQEKQQKPSVDIDGVEVCVPCEDGSYGV